MGQSPWVSKNQTRLSHMHECPHAKGHLDTVTHTDRMPGEEEAEVRVLLLRRTPETVRKIPEAGGAAVSSACLGPQRTQLRPHRGPRLWAVPPSLCSLESVSWQMIPSSCQGSSDYGVRTDRGSAFWTFHPGASGLSTYLTELLFATKQDGLLPPRTIRDSRDQVRPGGEGPRVPLEESQRELTGKLAPEMGLLPLLC